MGKESQNQVIEVELKFDSLTTKSSHFKYCYLSQYLERINRKLGCETKRKGINLTIVTPKRRVETWNVTSKL